ncbi:MAG: three-Cys-motif partner protein TcmP [Phycisphaerae bacterium]
MSADQEQLQMFGGDWTEKKLTVLGRYLKAYTTALKNQPFQKTYIDAFAGTGYRELKIDRASAPLFEELAEEGTQNFLDGSARIALQTVPRFDEYVFMEKSRKRVGELEKLKKDGAFSAIANSISIQQGESNELLRSRCAKPIWNQCRAVVFLDPFGMQVEWSTMEAIARTHAIDVWILFPLGMAVNRVLTSDFEKMPPAWASRLTTIFGCDEWRKLFYNHSEANPIFGGGDTRIKKSCTLEQIGNYYHHRLKTIFPAVADNPAVLKNSTGSPLFQLHFAAANEGGGGKIALKIAEHLLKEI